MCQETLEFKGATEEQAANIKIQRRALKLQEAQINIRQTQIRERRKGNSGKRYAAKREIRENEIGKFAEVNITKVKIESIEAKVRDRDSRDSDIQTPNPEVRENPLREDHNQPCIDGDIEEPSQKTEVGPAQCQGGKVRELDKGEVPGNGLLKDGQRKAFSRKFNVGTSIQRETDCFARKGEHFGDRLRGLVDFEGQFPLEGDPGNTHFNSSVDTACQTLTLLPCLRVGEGSQQENSGTGRELNSLEGKFCLRNEDPGLGRFAHCDLFEGDVCTQGLARDRENSLQGGDPEIRSGLEVKIKGLTGDLKGLVYRLLSSIDLNDEPVRSDSEVESCTQGNSGL